jgi:flagellar hook-basal body complex protein FliE
MNNTISPVRILPVEVGIPRARVAEGSKFLETLQQTMDEVQDVQGDAQSKVAELLNGNGTDLHRALIAVEKADLSFQLMMQVRNKIVAAYQEVSRMQF